ncbi:MAG: cytochrome c [bacterium]|nr:cytochrome C [Deltaproteobacteria bacterium]MCP4241835.1 cytochrome c [bacterium]
MKLPVPVVITVLAVLWATGCDRLPGKPDAAGRYQRPTEIMDFTILYGQNCSGCHGAQGRLGPSRPLADPLYLAYVGSERMRQIVAHGVPGTSMPAFAESSGGTLTEEQIAALVREIYERWGDAARVKGALLPSYEVGATSTAGGDAAFAAFCADCHGTDGSGGEKAGSVVDPDYLALVSDQMLRTSVVVGRTDLGMPDWREAGDRPMTPQEITDVVTWMTARRKAFPEAQLPGAPGNGRN